MSLNWKGRTRLVSYRHVLALDQANVVGSTWERARYISEIQFTMVDRLIHLTTPSHRLCCWSLLSSTGYQGRSRRAFRPAYPAYET